MEYFPDSMRYSQQGGNACKTCNGITWATSWENLFIPYANNKGADQSAHPRSVISAFVVRCLDRIILLVSISEISSLFCGWAGRFESTLVANPEYRFSRDEAQVYLVLHRVQRCTVHHHSTHCKTFHFGQSHKNKSKNVERKPHWNYAETT